MMIFEGGAFRTTANEAARRAHLAAIVSTSTDAIFSADASGRIVSANPAGQRMFGYTPRELAAMNVAGLAPPEGSAVANDCLSRLAGGETLTEIEVECRRKDGSRFPALLSASPMVDAQGAVTGSSAILHDITELKRAQQDLKQAFEVSLSLERQLNQAQKMEAVGRLAGGVAHDFNNLLTAILGFTQINMETLAAEDPRRADMEEILKAGRSATALTGQLLAFSRRQIMTPEVLDVNVVVSDVRTLLNRVIGEDVSLVTELDDRSCYVHADRGQLEQVLMNLAVNSRDAMPHGGTLRISTRDEGDQVILAVHDSGGGMPPDVLAHAFEPFYTTKATGTGLGLATVYGIVRQSGGTISVESQPDQGTCFTMALPKVSAPATPGAVVASASLAPHATQAVLVVEDQAEVRHITRRALEAHGYRVFDAEGGEAALDMMLAHPGEIDLLLTDVVMPVMSGRQLADAIKACDSKVRVLFMSGYIDDPIVRDRVMDRDVDFIRKPFMPDELVSRVEQVLAR